MYFNESGGKMTVAFYTLGCKVNQYETNLMIKQFEDNNFEVVRFEDKSDIYVINSCSVTNLSTRKTRQMLSRAKKINSDAIVILVGCYAEEIKFSDSKKLSNEIFDIILGNEEKKDIITHLNKFIDSGESVKHNKLFKVADISKVKRYVQPDRLEKGVNILRESVKIEDGCNNFCSYCIIPYTRGRVRSRNIEDIITEIENLVRNGTKEVVLVGIEIASYGIDLEDDISLIDVIEKINNIEGLKRIRLRIN
jgi:threonylcarbamoyladenosine tRNA methylthiotransferase MtaB